MAWTRSEASQWEAGPGSSPYLKVLVAYFELYGHREGMKVYIESIAPPGPLPSSRKLPDAVPGNTPNRPSAREVLKHVANFGDKLRNR